MDSCVSGETRDPQSSGRNGKEGTDDQDKRSSQERAIGDHVCICVTISKRYRRQGSAPERPQGGFSAGERRRNIPLI